MNLKTVLIFYKMKSIRSLLIKNPCLLKNRGYATQFKDLVELQHESLQHFSDKPIFAEVDRDTQQFEWINHKDWDQQIKDTTQQLIQHDIKAGDKVTLIGKNSIDWATIAYACYHLGAIFVPLYESQKLSEWEYIMNDCSSKLLLCNNLEVMNNCLHLENKLSNLENVLTIQHLRESSLKFTIENQHQVKSSDVATIIYTSGTTGNPKGVELTHQNLVSNIKSLRGNFENFDKMITDNDCSLSFLPWAHCYGQTCELHSGISLGTKIAIAESIDKLPVNLQQVKPNIIFSVPSLFNKIQQNIKSQTRSSFLKRVIINKARQYSKQYRESPTWLNYQKYNLADKIVFKAIKDKLGGQVTHCFTGGASISLEVLELFEDIGIPIIEGYGLSETAPIISLNEIDYPIRKLGSVGMPLKNLEVKLVEQEIWLSGPSVMRGYHNDKQANDEVFEYLDGKKYFKTGDLGSFDEQGRLFIIGRRKEQYKLENGKYVTPNLVEGYLGLSPLFKYVIMYGNNQEYNILIVIPNEDILLEELIKKEILSENIIEDIYTNSKVRAFLEKFISDYCVKYQVKKYEIPQRILLVPDFITGTQYITPKLSLKKEKIFQRLESEIERTYQLEK